MFVLLRFCCFRNAQPRSNGQRFCFLLHFRKSTTQSKTEHHRPPEKEKSRHVWRAGHPIALRTGDRTQEPQAVCEGAIITAAAHREGKKRAHNGRYRAAAVTTASKRRKALKRQNGPSCPLWVFAHPSRRITPHNGPLRPRKVPGSFRQARKSKHNKENNNRAQKSAAIL